MSQMEKIDGDEVARAIHLITETFIEHKVPNEVGLVAIFLILEDGKRRGNFSAVHVELVPEEFTDEVIN